MSISRKCEDALMCILEHFDGNASDLVHIPFQDFPEYMKINITETFEELKWEGLIASSSCCLAGADIYLTPDGIKYFLPHNALDLLRRLLIYREERLKYCQFLFSNADSETDTRLRAMFRKLVDEKMLSVKWADNIPYQIDFAEEAYEFEESGYAYKNTITENVTINAEKVNYKSIDKSQNITTISMESGEKEVFEEILKIAKGVKDNVELLQSIVELEGNYGKPCFRDKLTSFIQNSANCMTLFAPFIPTLMDMIPK